MLCYVLITHCCLILYVYIRNQYNISCVRLTVYLWCWPFRPHQVFMNSCVSRISVSFTWSWLQLNSNKLISNLGLSLHSGPSHLATRSSTHSNLSLVVLAVHGDLVSLWPGGRRRDLDPGRRQRDDPYWWCLAVPEAYWAGAWRRCEFATLSCRNLVARSTCLKVV